jgi:hypothetical protein
MRWSSSPVGISAANIQYRGEGSPHGGFYTPCETLLGAVPVESLEQRSSPVDEEEDVAVNGISDVGSCDGVEPGEPFSEIRWLGVEEEASPREVDHDAEAISAVMSSMVRPSNSHPLGAEREGPSWRRTLGRRTGDRHGKEGGDIGVGLLEPVAQRRTGDTQRLREHRPRDPLLTVRTDVRADSNAYLGGIAAVPDITSVTIDQGAKSGFGLGHEDSWMESGV